MLSLLIFYLVTAVARGDLYEHHATKNEHLDYQIQPKFMNRDAAMLHDINGYISPEDEERVKIALYYESMCPGCRQFDTTEFNETVFKLYSHLDVHVYPYGFAQTIEKDGHIEFTCQHGPEECYGNKLHACAIDYLNNLTTAISYNTCMMGSTQADHGSDDAAADACGKSMSINSEPIKECAKGDKGSQLLKKYGEETGKVIKDMPYVPFVMINGVESTDALDNFMKAVCKAFKKPPSACNKLV